MTRSRSHDISESEAPQYTDKSQKGSNTYSDRGALGVGRRATKDRKKKKPQEPGIQHWRQGFQAEKWLIESLLDLSIVNEDPDVATEAGLGGNDAGFEDGQDQSQLPNIKSYGRVSGFSGTTARTSGSAQDLNDLGSEDQSVLDALPELLESSKRFLSGVVPAEISSKSLSQIRSQLQDKRSGVSRSANKFKVDQESCLHDQSSIFLDVSRALPLLYGKEATGELLSQGPDSVFHAANLATLAQNLLLYTPQRSEYFLEQLDMSFPKLFTNDRSDTLELQLETRSQYAIMQLSYHMAQPNFDHDLVLNRVFFDGEGNSLRGLDHLASRSKEFKVARKLMLQRLEDLRRFWDEEEPIEALRIFYSWDKYVGQMMVWIHENSEISKAQTDATKLEDVVQSLKATIDEMRHPKQPSNSGADVNLNSGHIDLSGFVPPAEVVTAAAQPKEMQPQPKIRDRELAVLKSLKYVFHP